jgi:hypothetical protein
VVEAAAERHRVARRIDDRKARLPALNGADARERHAELAGERVDFPAPLAWRGEQQLVVVAAESTQSFSSCGSLNCAKAASLGMSA